VDKFFVLVSLWRISPRGDDGRSGKTKFWFHATPTCKTARGVSIVGKNYELGWRWGRRGGRGWSAWGGLCCPAVGRRVADGAQHGTNFTLLSDFLYIVFCKRFANFLKEDWKIYNILLFNKLKIFLTK
jgi:hypothetical protein